MAHDGFEREILMCCRLKCCSNVDVRCVSCSSEHCIDSRAMYDTIKLNGIWAWLTTATDALKELESEYAELPPASFVMIFVLADVCFFFFV